MSYSVAFVDTSYPRPYGLSDVGLAPLGGTELTLLRVASELSAIHEVVIYQAGCLVTNFDDRLVYKPADTILNGEALPDTIVVINSWKVACRLRKSYPEARILVWLHVFPGKHHKKMGALLAEANINVVAVSQSHASSISATFRKNSSTYADVHYIYNPVSDELMPDDSERNLDMLLYASSPHKGLDEVFQQFTNVRQTIPSLHLRIADPGYLKWPTDKIPEHVKFIGRLDQIALVSEMRQSLCLFYPQTSFAETFGLVIAECHAVGTPALVHEGLGANNEIAGYSDSLINGTDFGAITERIEQYRNELPKVSANPDFRLSAVIKKWNEMLFHNPRQQSSKKKRVSIHD